MILATILLAAATAAPAPTVPPGPTVDSIVADYVKARGGLAKIRAVQTLRQTGHAYAEGGRHALVVREVQRPDKSRFEFTVQGVTAVFVANGATGWQVSPLDGQMTPTPMSKEAIADAMEQADIEGPLVDWKAKGNRVELAGFEQVGGKNAYRLQITLKDGSVRYDYIDEASYRHVRTDVDREVRGRTVSTHAIFSGHRMQNGVLFPGVVEIEAVGRPQKLRVVVDKIEVNPKLAPQRFEKAVPKD